MDITPYVESLRRDLLAAAEAAGPEARDATERLSYALDPAARLALMEAISQAAAEITAELPAGGVNVVRAATREGAINVDIDLSSIPFLSGGNDPFGGKRGGKRMSGWL